MRGVMWASCCDRPSARHSSSRLADVTRRRRSDYVRSARTYVRTTGIHYQQRPNDIRYRLKNYTSLVVDGRGRPGGAARVRFYVLRSQTQRLCTAVRTHYTTYYTICHTLCLSVSASGGCVVVETLQKSVPCCAQALMCCNITMTVARAWNSLPTSITALTSLPSFKRQLKTFSIYQILPISLIFLLVICVPCPRSYCSLCHVNLYVLLLLLLLLLDGRRRSHGTQQLQPITLL